MARHLLLIAAATSLVGASGVALAQPAYRANDIVKHFAPGLGSARGLCIGTEAECKFAPQQGASAAPTPPRESFDLVVTFDYNSDKLTNEARANLTEFAKALKDPLLASASFFVDGHTDAKGGERYNLLLSERRAAAVIRFLSEQGASLAKLQARGFGEGNPRVADPNDPANRRVETRLQLQ